MKEEIVLEMGKKETLKFSFFSSMNVIYAGMPSEKTFSIAIIEGFGNYRYSTNLFFEKNKSTIKFGDKEFRVSSVTPDKLILHPVDH